MTAFQPSKYQTAIFDFISSERGNGIVNAVAGSGKTTSLVQGARLVKSDALFVAFNKHIADELSTRLTGTRMTASTIHSIGFRAVGQALGGRRAQVEDRKYPKLIRSWMNVSYHNGLGDYDTVADRLRTLTNLTRLTLTDPAHSAQLGAMAGHFGVDLDGWEGPIVRQLLEQGDRLALEGAVIDFTDMVYLPHRWELRPSPVGFVAVDEAQDLNAAQQALVLKLRAPGGRMLAVGDPQQAIYGFSGADSDAFQRLAGQLDARSLPLSICYRCPSSHVELARELVPHIEARPGAPEGLVERLAHAALDRQVRAGDLILCRLTAPLIKTCLELIRGRVHARVRGRDIGAAMGRLVRAVERVHGYTWPEFPRCLAEYVDAQVAHLVARDASPARIDALRDQQEAILVCYEAAQAQSAGELSVYIEGLFDDTKPAVTLSTVHRAKGLENDRVFILEPDKLPLRWKNQQPWEYQQELNLKYVALTRAKHALYFVEEGPLWTPAPTSSVTATQPALAGVA
jgi:superfamily I DNA/RNA helicase